MRAYPYKLKKKKNAYTSRTTTAVFQWEIYISGLEKKKKSLEFGILYDCAIDAMTIRRRGCRFFHKKKKKTIRRIIYNNARM